MNVAYYSAALLTFAIDGQVSRFVNDTLALLRACVGETAWPMPPYVSIGWLDGLEPEPQSLRPIWRGRLGGRRAFIRLRVSS